MKKKILVAPLDWGLGHATRCIPIIRELLLQNYDVYIAGDSNIKSLLKKEFPHLPFLNLPGYKVQYSKKKWLLPFTIFFQMPKIIKAIHYENAWLNQMVLQYQIDAVISDNRFGLHHKYIKTVFITHQLYIVTPMHWSDKLLQQINYRFINKFSECWIPDCKAQPNLAGALSHPAIKPQIPLQYIGPLSRFAPLDNETENYYLILLSGPEPQRSILEKKLLLQLNDLDQPVIFVRGLPGEDNLPKVRPHITLYNHLPASELQHVVSKALLVISRCGYSTVMDLMALGKKSILIPTPGQTEQEYLGTYLMKQGLALSFSQNTFQLKAALSLMESFPFQLNKINFNNSLLRNALKNLVTEKG